MKKRQAHEFAFFLDKLPEQNQKVTLQDEALVRRITGVLRLAIGDTVVFFNQKEHVRLTLSEQEKKVLIGNTGGLAQNTIYQPAVTLLLPILKRDALEAAIYGAVECGVTNIQLITTQKCQRKWGGQKEFERLQRIVIAAAEQSKCFAFAHLLEPISLEAALGQLKNVQLLFADPSGTELQKPSQNCAVLVGPEGDLTDTEKKLVKTAGAIFFKLTPTILRATQAAVLSVGLIRSI